MPKKNPRVDLRLKYQRIFEISIILSLFLIITAFRYFPRIEAEDMALFEEKPFITTVDVPLTGIPEAPPPPPKPIIPIEVPDDEELPDIDINNTEWSENDFVMPPQPPVDDSKVMNELDFIVVEEMPEIIGGLKMIQSKIIYPEIAKRAGVQGKVYVMAVINKDGSVESAKIVSGIGAGCDEAAIAAVLKTKFKPGKQRGKPVRVQITIPISFKLN